MSEVSSSADPVVLAKRRATGEAFSGLFREGMALVEMTASYLDGPGRKEAKGLDRSAALSYATESMRLPTGLMQLAWGVLLQRGVNEGELTFDQARAKKIKVKLAPSQPPHQDSLAALPKKLLQLIANSRRLHEQVTRLDQLVYGGVETAPVPIRPGVNPVETQMRLLEAAFRRADR